METSTATNTDLIMMKYSLFSLGLSMESKVVQEKRKRAWFNLIKRDLTTEEQQQGQSMIQHSSGEEESRISYNENSGSLEQDEEIDCDTAKPMNCQSEAWHIKKP
jgi:hypothetical protein